MFIASCQHRCHRCGKKLDTCIKLGINEPLTIMVTPCEVCVDRQAEGNHEIHSERSIYGQQAIPDL